MFKEDVKTCIRLFISTRTRVTTEPTRIWYQNALMGSFYKFLDSNGMGDILPKDIKKRILDYYFQFLSEKNVANKYRDGQKLSPATINSYHRAVSAFFNWLQREEYIIDNPMLKVEKAAVEKPIKATISEEQIFKMLEQFNRKTFVGYRNYCILLMLYDLGMRRQEIVGLEVNDIDLDSQLLTIKRSKCRKGRILPIGISTEKALRRYLVMREVQAEKAEIFIDSGRLFIQENGKPIFPDIIRKILSSGQQKGLV